MIKPYKWLIAILRNIKCPSIKASAWEKGISDELYFWDEYFRTGGLDWPDDLRQRLIPEQPLQEYIRSFIPDNIMDISILDVGAGPLTYLGKKWNGKNIHITAVDPLADEYNKILFKYHITPLLKTEKLAAEQLTDRFTENSFDFVYSRNAIDHSHDPEKAIAEMIKVVKPNCYVFMEHKINEAEQENYQGLHQWNFCLAGGEFMITSRKKSVNISAKYADNCEFKCWYDQSGTWFSAAIKKRSSSDMEKV